MDDKTLQEILAENARRKARLVAPYDPISGVGAIGERTVVATPLARLPRAHVPLAMVNDDTYSPDMPPNEWEKLRCRHDFEYWAARCVTIRDKLTGRDVPLRLNVPQRRVLGQIEQMRLAGRPIRLIMLKARQWGSSTLVQMMMAWIQICHRRNWHSLICAHVKDCAAGIRAMYAKMLDNYPPELWDGDREPGFKPFERTINVRELCGRGCRLTIASAEAQEAVRGGDYAMAHLSETAFWTDSAHKSPADFIRAVCGSIALEPLTVVAMESTANGVGNYFHTEWLRCKQGDGDKLAIFVPWHEIEIYRMDVADPAALWDELTPYERNLWSDHGLTLEQICWYHYKAREYPSQAQMQAEFPTDDVEAFTNTGRNVFALAHIERLRKGCREPIRGELNSQGRFAADPVGRMAVWEMPRPGGRYIIAVDVGGRSAASDYSVICVLRRSAVPEVAAQWRGHVDHDVLVKLAAMTGRLYNNALLVVESNTLESETEGAGSDPSLFLLNRLVDTYPNLYFRPVAQPAAAGSAMRPGFHTNRATKTMIITELIEAVRDGLYIERDMMACDELTVYEQLPNGAYAASSGHHDDILMTRAIGLHIALFADAITPPVTPLLHQPSWP